MENREIARFLEDLAALLELEQANPFRVRAYRNAALTVRDWAVPMRAMLERGEDLTRLEFVGKDLAAVIAELARTGTARVYQELTTRVPASLLEVLRVPGLGVKKAARLWQELGVTSLAELEQAAREGHIAALPGFGPKSQENILRRVTRLRGG